MLYLYWLNALLQKDDKFPFVGMKILEVRQHAGLSHFLHNNPQGQPGDSLLGCPFSDPLCARLAL
jgi:hypothetical protein